MAKAKTKPEFKICEAALAVAVRQGWKALTLEAVAKEAKRSVPQLKKLYPSKDDLLPGIVRMIDTEAAAFLSKPDLTASPHDRLFDALMARIDALQSHRTGILALIDGLKGDPRLLRKLFPAQIKSMQAHLKYAGLTQPKTREAFIIAGLLGLYGLTLCIWQNDSSPDMARTMAALDRNLRRAGTAMDILFRVRSRF